MNVIELPGGPPPRPGLAPDRNLISTCAAPVTGLFVALLRPHQ